MDIQKLQFGKPEDSRVKTEEGIFLDGAQIGTFYIYHSGEACRPFHCALKLYPGGLIQGHGTTREAAIKEAMYWGRREAEFLMVSINNFEKTMGGAA